MKNWKNPEIIELDVKETKCGEPTCNPTLPPSQGGCSDNNQPWCPPKPQPCYPRKPWWWFWF